MRMFLSVALLGAWIALAPQGAVAAAVAMVTDLQGPPAVANGKTKLGLLAYVEAGAEIQVEANAKLTLTFLARPLEQTFNGPAKIVVQADKVEVLQGKAGATRKLDPDKVSSAKKFEPAAHERMAQATFVMRSAVPPGGKLELIGPVESRVATTQPEFSWKGPKDAQSYKISLLDEYGKPLAEHNLKTTSWQPHGKQSLAPGRAYNWKVDAMLASGQVESAQSRFVILERAAAKKLDKQKPKVGAPFSERVLYAAMLESDGLKYEAVAAWRALARERPDDPALQQWAK